MKVLKVVMKLICLCHRIDGVWFTMQRSIVCNMTVQYTNKNNEEDIVVHQCKLKTPKSSYLDDLSSILTWERKEPKSFLQCIQNCIFVVFSINRTGKQKQARRLHGHLFPFPMFFAVATWSRPQTQLGTKSFLQTETPNSAFFAWPQLRKKYVQAVLNHFFFQIDHSIYL